MFSFGHTLRAALWALTGRWLQIVLGFATLAVTARLLGPEPYGVFTMAMLIVGFGDMLVSGALTESLIQRKDLKPGHLAATFWMVLAIATLIWAGMALTAILLSHHFNLGHAAEILPYCAAFLIFTAAGSVPFAMLMRDMRYRAMTVIESTAGVLASACGILLALNGAGVWSLVAMEAVRVVTRNLMAFVFARWFPNFSGRWSDLRELAAFNLSVVATSFVGYIDRTAPRAIVGSLLGEQALGLFAMGMRVYEILTQLFVGPLSAVALPAVSRAQHDRALLHKLIQGILRLASVAAYPVFIGAAAIAPIFTPLAFGAQWTPAVLTMQILILVGLRTSTAIFNTPILRGSGDPGGPVIIGIVGAVASVAFSFIGSAYGDVGVALGALARALATAPLAALLIQRATGFSMNAQFNASIPALVAGVAMGGISYITANYAAEHFGPVPALLISISAGVVFYLGALALIAPDMVRMGVRVVQSILRRDPDGIEAALNPSPATP